MIHALFENDLSAHVLDPAAAPNGRLVASPEGLLPVHVFPVDVVPPMSWFGAASTAADHSPPVVVVMSLANSVPSGR